MFIEITDAGRSNARPQEKKDCTVRAMALAFGLTYSEAYDFMIYEVGYSRRNGAHLDKYLRKNPELFDKVCKYESFPASGSQRVTLERFCDEYRCGVWIVSVKQHVLLVRDGVVFDDRLIDGEFVVLNAIQVKDCDYDK